MTQRTRMMIYFAFVLSSITASVFVLRLAPSQRSEFLRDYGRTLGRIVTGDWEFTELTESERRSRNFHPQRRGRRGVQPDAIFERLDVDSDQILTTEELGQQLSVSFANQTRPLQLTSDQFRKALETSWAPPPRAAELMQAESEELTADNLFQPDRIVQVDVTIADDDWQALCNQSRDHHSAFRNPLAKPYTNFKCDITVNGHRIQDVAIRKKGFIGSQDRVRPSLKIKFDEYVEQSPIAGLDRLTLNNNKQDRGLVSQSLTYFLFRKAGIPAPRHSFATVTVNGRYLGIYSNVESVRKPFLESNFGDDSGNLYEGTLTDLYPKSMEWIEPKTNKSDNDRSRLLRLSLLLESDAATAEAIGEIVNLDRFVRYWAVESLINFWDGYTMNQNNYFIYDNPIDHQMYFMPWGADSCFGFRPHFVRRGGSQAASVHTTSILANKLYSMEQMPEHYRTALLEVLEEVWNEEELIRETNRIEQLLSNHLSFQQIDSLNAREDIRRFIRGRRQLIMSELTSEWPVRVDAGPRIPMHTVEIGSASGSFSLSEDTSETSSTMTLEGDEVEFDNVVVTDEDIVLSANHGGRLLELQIKLDAGKNYRTGKPEKVTGRLQLDSWREGDQVRGELTLNEATTVNSPETTTETSPGLVGEFQVKIVQTRGRR